MLFRKLSKQVLNLKKYNGKRYILNNHKSTLESEELLHHIIYVLVWFAIHIIFTLN